MASTLLKNLRLSKLMLNTGRLWSRGYVASPSMLIHSPTKNTSMYKIKNFSSQPTTNPTNDQLKQMQDYFNQYIEDYYEKDEEEESEPHFVAPPVKEINPLQTIEDVVELLKGERASNLVVLDLKDDGPGPIRTLIICTSFNTRHAHSVAEALRKAARIENDGVTKRSVRNGFGWFQVGVGEMQIHVMSEDARERFDIDSLWGIGEEVDDVEEIPSIPPPRS